MKYTTKSIRPWDQEFDDYSLELVPELEEQTICKGDIAMDLFFSLNIGVIGGADGPTAIFVSGGPSVWFWVGVGITVVAAVGLFVYWFQKRK